MFLIGLGFDPLPFISFFLSIKLFFIYEYEVMPIFSAACVSIHTFSSFDSILLDELFVIAAITQIITTP
jgi:hypothetical protein